MEKSLLTIDDYEHLGMHDKTQVVAQWGLALCIGERYGKNNDKTLVLSQQISDIILYNKLVLFFKKKNPIGKR